VKEINLEPADRMGAGEKAMEDDHGEQQDWNTSILTKSMQWREKEQVKRPDIFREIVRRVGVHSDGGQVKNILVTINNLVINSGDAKVIVRHLWKAVELYEQHYNKIQRKSTNADCSMEL
jgi:hypothetical protein